MKKSKKTYNIKINRKTKKKNVIYNSRGGGNIIMSYFNYNREHDNTVNHANNNGRCMCVNYSKNNQGRYTIPENETRCNRKATGNSDFCDLHKDCKSFLNNYTTGNEPDYNPSSWAHPYIQGSHNCYSYFLDDRSESIKDKCKEMCLKKHKTGCPKKISECSNLKPQPGDFGMLLNSGSLKGKKRNYSCPLLEQKVMSDNPHISKTTLTNKCPSNYYKGAIVVDPNHTFHFYRQNKNSTWSHKPGTLPISEVDADNKYIYVPHYANRDYTKLKRKNENPINYTDFCGYYCIPNNNHINTNMI